MRIDAVPRTRWATGQRHERDRHRPDERRPGDPELAERAEPAEPRRRAAAGDEHDDGHAERGAAGGAEHERVGERVAEHGLHVHAAQAERRRRRAGRRSSAAGAPCAPRRAGAGSAWSGSTSAAPHGGGRQADRPEEQREECGGARATTSTPIATAARRLTPTPCRRPARLRESSISTSKIVQICTISRPENRRAARVSRRPTRSVSSPGSWVVEHEIVVGLELRVEHLDVVAEVVGDAYRALLDER